MRLPPFDYLAPLTLEDVLKAKAEFGSSAVFLAGGTDLVVNLKHRLLSPATVISLKNVPDLKGIREEGATVVIGACAGLAETASHPLVMEHFPLLVRAVESIGAVSIQRHRGSIGGNICLTPRCVFYNQTLFWRKGKGTCHRTGGKDCLALKGAESCQAVCSGDTVPALIALSAQVTLRSVNGARTVPLIEFFTGKGENPSVLGPEELLTEVRIPIPWAPMSWSFQKIAMRSAVDFPLVNAAAACIMEKGRVEYFRLVLSALGPAPLLLREVERALKGAPPTIEAALRISDAATLLAEGVVVENAAASKQYRAKMAGVVARRAAQEALGLPGGPSLMIMS
jgi:4-hydroxybenzoyl-CoA reductase beta subunit